MAANSVAIKTSERKLLAEYRAKSPTRAESSQAGTRRAKLAGCFALTKPRITLMVTLTAAAGSYLGTPSAMPLDRPLFLHTLAGVWLLSSGIAALNQYIERDTDSLMRRTAARPLPAGILTPMQALIFGSGLTGIALLHLALYTGALAALVGVAVVIGYVLLYTPLKTRTPHSTTVGAIPGALPPMLGWAAARGRLGAEAWVLFAISTLR